MLGNSVFQHSTIGTRRRKRVTDCDDDENNYLMTVDDLTETFISAEEDEDADEGRRFDDSVVQKISQDEATNSLTGSKAWMGKKGVSVSDILVQRNNGGF
ncbi:hypothetical protein NPIL_247251 [Nephila pilipes]|uniref:Uncharacterized protein n=1 Tax=Nephila pilipes TaxID=299642 RepID=A0A8X6NH93_NEPPI|nr:hypothetical protein NPIL_247251 [Nephila pilipes]